METASRPSASWKAMLERTNSLVAQIVQRDDSIPPLERDPSQLKAAAQNLIKGHGSKTTSDNRAVRMFGQYSFDVDKLERDLHQIAPKASYDPTDHYDHHDRIISTTIDEALVATRTESQEQFRLLIEDDWESSKRELLEDLSHEANGAWGPLHERDGSLLKSQKLNPGSIAQPMATPFSNSYNKTQDLIGSQRARKANLSNMSHEGGAVHQMTAKMLSYSKVVERMAEYGASGQQGAGNWMSQFQSSVAEVPDSHSASVAQMWDLAGHMLGEHPQGGSSSTHKFGSLVKSTPRARKGVPSSEQQVAGARRFLESQYKLFIDRHTQYASNSSFAHDLASTIRTWLKLIRERPLNGLSALAESLSTNYGEPGDVEDPNLPLWGVVYYCMRCGGWKIAAQILREARDLNKLAQSDFKIVSILEALAERNEGDEENQTTSGSEGIEDVRALRDTLSAEERCSPWRRAVVQLVASDGVVSQDPVVQTSVEDYMWFKLCAVLSSDSSYSIQDLASMVLQVGPDHFNARSDPYLYTRLLLTCQCFEHAVAFLATQGFESMTDAVHLAIGLNAAGVLNVGSSYGLSVPNGSAHYGGEATGFGEVDPSAQFGSMYLIPARYRHAEVGSNRDNDGMTGDNSSALVVDVRGSLGDMENERLERSSENRQPAEVLDLGALVQQYVKRFARSDPRCSVVYIMQILMDDRSTSESHDDGVRVLAPEVEAFLEALLLESRDFETLLDGTAVRIDYGSDQAMPRDGMLFRQLRNNDLCLSIVQHAAREAQEQGFPEVAYELYLRGRMPQDLGNAIGVLNAQLAHFMIPTSQANSKFSNDITLRSRWLAAAEELQARLSRSWNKFAHQVDPSRLRTLEELVKLARFFDHVSSSRVSNPDKWEKALVLVRGLFPSETSECNTKVSFFHELDQQPMNMVISRAILAAMTCISELFHERKQLGDYEKMRKLKMQAQSLSAYANSLDVSDIARDLSNMEVRME